jgi:hypothetical protein
MIIGLLMIELSNRAALTKACDEPELYSREPTPILYSFDQSVGWVERAAKPNARSRTPMVSLRAQPILRELPITLDKVMG